MNVIGRAPARKPAVVVFAPVLLPYSQTFIRDHAAYLTEFEPMLVGLKRTDGIDLSDVPHATITRSPLSRWLLYWFGWSRELDGIMQRAGASLIHCHFADGAMILGRYCRRRGVPLVITIHGSDVLRERGSSVGARLRAHLVSLASLTAVAVLPVSDWLRSKLSDRGIVSSYVARHYLGIPIDDTSAASDPRSPSTILFAGRLVEKKGPNYLLEAARLLASRGVDFDIRIVGDGPMRPELEQMARSHQLPVTFTGALSAEVVRAEMRRAAVFCMPSTAATDGDNEGLGLVYVEAQASGLPVVAFDQGPIPEAVLNGVSGLLVPDKDIQSLADALQKLLEDPSQREMMGERGARFARERFDIRQQTRLLENLYGRVLAGGTVEAVKYD